MLDKLFLYIAIFIATLMGTVIWIGMFGQKTIQVTVSEPDADDYEFILTIPKFEDMS